MKKKIFVIDDDPGIQDIFKIILDSAGYATTIFCNGEEHLKMRNNYPDVYIIDKQLSGIDGLDLCRSLKTDIKTRDIPVIMVSASPNIEILAKIAGADDSIEKPFKIAELLNKVAKYVS